MRRARTGEDSELTIIRSTGIERTNNEFRYELVQLGHRLRINPDYLASVMAIESGFRPNAVNPNGGATGLIQLMPQTARSLGTSTNALKDMSAIEQLIYVEKFYKPWSGRLPQVGDAYMATFLPACVGRPSDYVLGKLDSDEKVCGLRSGTIYAQNRGLDINKDGVITVGDVTAVIEREYNRASQRERIAVTVPLEGIPPEIA